MDLTDLIGHVSNILRDDTLPVRERLQNAIRRLTLAYNATTVPCVERLRAATNPMDVAEILHEACNQGGMTMSTLGLMLEEAGVARKGNGEQMATMRLQLIQLPPVMREEVRSGKLGVVKAIQMQHKKKEK